MEKRMYPALPLIICNCGNQILVDPGCNCEVCMGVTIDSSELSFSSTSERKDQFDLSYFEALERLFESFEFAA
jgi:hypothetical protein